ncbi:hypothetical protein TWF506_011339 [Arthrobotrys conoides]|uniref:Uncharacterized protein n=1 Tax=Arthrobotrys conoides TaxID=74498 RepID=A0AAN8NAF6_9PEZI
MPCQQSNEFMHDIIFAIRTRKIYGTILMTVEDIEPVLAAEIESTLKSQENLKGEYTFSYDEFSKVIRLDMPLPDELYQIGKSEPYVKKSDLVEWPWGKEPKI